MATYNVEDLGLVGWRAQPDDFTIEDLRYHVVESHFATCFGTPDQRMEQDMTVTSGQPNYSAQSMNVAGANFVMQPAPAPTAARFVCHAHAWDKVVDRGLTLVCGRCAQYVAIRSGVTRWPERNGQTFINNPPNVFKVVGLGHSHTSVMCYVIEGHQIPYGAFFAINGVFDMRTGAYDHNLTESLQGALKLHQPAAPVPDTKSLAKAAREDVLAAAIERESAARQDYLVKKHAALAKKEAEDVAFFKKVVENYGGPFYGQIKSAFDKTVHIADMSRDEILRMGHRTPNMRDHHFWSEELQE